MSQLVNTQQGSDQEQHKPVGVTMLIGAQTKYILSTSGRITSLQRYQRLLQQLLQLDIVYLPIHSGSVESPAIDPVRFVSALRGMPCIGGAISKDIKHAVVDHLDELHESARDIRTVNTVIVKPDGCLVGYNTDALGFREAIVTGMQKSGVQIHSAVCYGYGGVASVVVSILQSLHIRVYIIGRDRTSAARRAEALGIEVWDGQDIDLFVNATPASEKPLHLAANFLEAIQSAKIAFDHEMPGKCLKEYCGEKGIYHISGYDMYYPQMRAQWSLFLEGLVDPEQLPRLLQEADNV